MSYSPHQFEVDTVPSMSDEELMEYFLYRIFEADEVWILKEDGQPVLREIDGHDILPIWPYKCFAEAAAIDEWTDLLPVSEPVDYFTYQTLNSAANQNVTVEIMPRGTAPGCLISPQRLFNMLENMMEARDTSVGD